MKVAYLVAVTLSLVACKKKHDEPTPAPTGSDVASGSGSAPVGSAATPVVTQAQVQAVGTEVSRLDELGTMLDKADVVGGPVALLDAITKLPEWTTITAKYDKLKAVDQVAASLKDGVAQLHTLRDGLHSASSRLGNLKGELDKQLAAANMSIDQVKKLVSTELRTSLEPLAAQVAIVVGKVIGPVSEQLTDTADLIIGACAMTKLSGGGKEIQDLCANAKQTFQVATTFLADLKAKPTTLYTEVSGKLEKELNNLIDDGVKAALDTAQKQVDAALNLPTGAGSGSGSGSNAGSASGSAAGSGSGSAK